MLLLFQRLRVAPLLLLPPLFDDPPPLPDEEPALGAGEEDRGAEYPAEFENPELDEGAASYDGLKPEREGTDDGIPGPGSTRRIVEGSTRYDSRGKVGNEEMLFLPRDPPLLREPPEFVPLLFDPPEEGAGRTAGDPERPEEPPRSTDPSRLRPGLDVPRVTFRPASLSAFRLEGAGAEYPEFPLPAVLLADGRFTEEPEPSPFRP